MKFSLFTMALPAVTSAVMVPRGDYQKYKCMTLDKWIDTNVPCATNCEKMALWPADGCHKDDFYCHCKRTQRIDDLIAPCMLADPSTPAGVNHTCSNDDLGTFQGSVTALCKYFNATGYQAYASCPMVPWKQSNGDRLD